jgi:MYXO-CTERM domain-containing protein
MVAYLGADNIVDMLRNGRIDGGLGRFFSKRCRRWGCCRSLCGLCAVMTLAALFAIRAVLQTRGTTGVCVCLYRYRIVGDEPDGPFLLLLLLLLLIGLGRRHDRFIVRASQVGHGGTEVLVDEGGSGDAGNRVQKRTSR